MNLKDNLYQCNPFVAVETAQRTLARTIVIPHDYPCEMFSVAAGFADLPDLENDDRYVCIRPDLYGFYLLVRIHEDGQIDHQRTFEYLPEALEYWSEDIENTAIVAYVKSSSKWKLLTTYNSKLQFATLHMV